MAEWLFRLVKKPHAYLVILTLLYLMMRSAILFTAIDKVHLDEELYRGNIAQELIAGPAFPFLDYQRSEYEGGSLVVGALTVPFFLIIGTQLISFKLLALLAGTGIFVLWYLFLERFFNRRVAVWTSLLLILLPPVWIKASLYNVGAQYEVNLFIILAVTIFYRIFLEKKTNLRFGLLGAVCGFGLFFHYSFLPTFLTILLFWYVFDKRFIFKKDFLIFAAAFLAGFSPWIFYNLTHHFQGLIACDHPLSYWFSRNNPLHFISKLKNFFTIDVPGVFSFADPILRFEPRGLLEHWFFSRFYGALFLIAFLSLLWLNRESLFKIVRRLIPLSNFSVSPQEFPKEVFLLVLFLVFAVTLCVSGIEFNVSYYEGSVYRYRHIGPIGLFVPTLIAVFLFGRRTPFKHRFASYLSFGVMALLIGLGLLSDFNFISTDPVRRVALSGIYRGYNYYDLGRVIAWRYDGSPRWIDSIKKIKDGEARRYCYSGMGWGYAEDKFDTDYHVYLTKRLPRIERDYWPYAYEWMGEALERELKYDKAKGIELRKDLDPRLTPNFYRGVGRQAASEVYGRPEYALQDFRERVEEEYAPFFYYGLGVGLFDVLVDRPEKFFYFMDAVDKKFKPVIYEGLAEGKEYYRFIHKDFGFGIGNVGYNIGAWKSIVTRVEPEYRPQCYRRLGIEIGWRFIHDVAKYVRFLKAVDPEYRAYLYRGLGTGIGWRFAYDLKGCKALIQNIDPTFWPYVYEGLGAGMVRRYAYPKEAWAEKSDEIPADDRPYFESGIRSEFERRFSGGRR